jgi:hypothetical protein
MPLPVSVTLPSFLIANTLFPSALKNFWQFYQAGVLALSSLTFPSSENISNNHS